MVKRDDRAQKTDSDIAKKVVAVNRVTKVVKGGRTMRFAALVVVGDENGKVGVGTGKASEVAESIEKATNAAKKNMFSFPITGTSIPHEVVGIFGRGKVLMFPASAGTGVIAGGAVRSLLEVSGIKDIRTKSIGSNNPINSIKATVDALKQLKTIEEIAALRGKTPDEIRG